MHDLEMLKRLNAEAADKQPKLSVIREALEQCPHTHTPYATHCIVCRALAELDKLQ